MLHCQIFYSWQGANHLVYKRTGWHLANVQCEKQGRLIWYRNEYLILNSWLQVGAPVCLLKLWSHSHTILKIINGKMGHTIEYKKGFLFFPFFFFKLLNLTDYYNFMNLAFVIVWECPTYHFIAPKVCV